MRTIDQTYDAAISIEAIMEHPDNPRRGNDAAVAESVEANGFFGAVLVQKSTGMILAGNTRFRVARSEGQESLPGFWLDVDDEQAKRILLADNRMSDLAFYDDKALVDLLDGLHDTDGGLLGTGYTDDQLALMLDAQDDILDIELPDDEIDGTEGHMFIRLDVSTDTIRLWSDHRAQHNDDNSALAALLAS